MSNTKPPPKEPEYVDHLDMLVHWAHCGGEYEMDRESDLYKAYRKEYAEFVRYQHTPRDPDP